MSLRGFEIASIKMCPIWDLYQQPMHQSLFPTSLWTRATKNLVLSKNRLGFKLVQLNYWPCATYKPNTCSLLQSCGFESDCSQFVGIANFAKVELKLRLTAVVFRIMTMEGWSQLQLMYWCNSPHSYWEHLHLQSSLSAMICLHNWVYRYLIVTDLSFVFVGLSIGLVEKFDFSAGTSSRSTKLIHGGVRYLQKAVFNLDYVQVQ